MFLPNLTFYKTVHKKIISLVPSITELLHFFKLHEETIGITKFCIHPHEWYITKTIIGGTKNINIEKILALNPDLIICAKEENTKAQVELLAKSFPVYVCDVKSYDDSLCMINDIGILTNKQMEASQLIKSIENTFSEIEIIATNKITASYIIWKEPYMTVGYDTFIHDMMSKIGIENIYKKKIRYPIFNIEELQTLNPSLILLSSEPYPFSETHIEEMKKYFPNAKVMLADGEMFSWYGSRMLLMPAYFVQLKNAIIGY